LIDSATYLQSKHSLRSHCHDVN